MTMMKSDNRKAAKAVFCIIKNPWKEVGRLAKKLKNLEVTKVDFVDEEQTREQTSSCLSEKTRMTILL